MVTLLARRGVLVAAVATALLSSVVAFATAAPALDTTFGGGVISPKLFSGGKGKQVARDVAIQADGKVLAPMALSVKYERQSERPVVRFKADGTLDRAYGKNGAAWLSVPGEKYVGLSRITLQPDGKALVNGAAANTRTGLDDYFMARLTSSGKLDKSFGRGGMTKLSPGPHGRELLKPYPLSDGRTILAFKQSNGKDSTLAFVRLKKNGLVDYGYGDHGTIVFDIARGLKFPDFADIEVVGSGAFVLLNPDPESTGKPCKVFHLNLSSSGGRVKSFGNNGTAMLAAFGKNDALECRDLTSTSDGGVAVAATLLLDNFNGYSDGVVYKLLADGSRDPSFGVGGKVQGPDEHEYAGIATLPSGGFILAGSLNDPGDVNGPRGGLVSSLDARGGLVDLLAGSTLPLTNHSYLWRLANGPAGSVLLYSHATERGEGRTVIAKFTN